MSKITVFVGSDDGEFINIGHKLTKSKYFYEYTIDATGKVKLVKKLKNSGKPILPDSLNIKKIKIPKILKDVNIIISTQVSPFLKRLNMKGAVQPVISKIFNIQELIEYIKENFSYFNHIIANRISHNIWPDIPVIAAPDYMVMV